MKNNRSIFYVALMMISLIVWLEGCAQNNQSETSTVVTTEPDTSIQKPSDTQACTTDACENDEILIESDRHPMTRQFDRMVHNAELSDMSLADIHFLPHRPNLNSNGTSRLYHLAWMIERYGGTITLDFEQPDSPIAQARLEQVVEYLKTQNLPNQKIQVRLGLPQTRGMDAKEAVMIYEDTRYKPEQEQPVH